MNQHGPRIVAFLLFGFGGTLVGVILNAMPLRIPTIGWAFFLGWWIAAAIGGALLPRGVGKK